MAKKSLKDQHRQEVQRVNQVALRAGGAVAMLLVLAMVVSLAL